MTQTDTIFQSTSPSYHKNTSADPDGSSPWKLHNMHNKCSKKVRKFIISPQADGIKITCTKKVTQFVPYPTDAAPKVTCSPQKKEPKHTIACSSHLSQNLIGTSASMHPTFNTYIKWYYVITVGQEVGIFFDWHNVKARIEHVSSACQSKHPTWQAALLKYTQNFNNGTIEARPFPGGLFDKCQHPAPQRRVVIDLCTNDEESDSGQTGCRPCLYLDLQIWDII
ncbi:hypothetical protein L208DRAFT_1382030 [Tricholoma matsutake]|nr:hypothetical protein L208DRAFT_1382030 [Tricholoma matsutake 945]